MCVLWTADWGSDAALSTLCPPAGCGAVRPPLPQTGTIVDAMEERAFGEGDVIIRQGDPGEHLYILAAGTCDIFKDGVCVLQCSPGMVFGELALMYDAPRAATVVATSPVRTWAMDRLTFKQVMFGTTLRRVSPLGPPSGLSPPPPTPPSPVNQATHAPHLPPWCPHFVGCCSPDRAAVKG
jgi:hypothetical protein